MNDIDTVKALLDKAGVAWVESHTGASEGGVRTYLTISSNGGQIVFQFSGQNDLAGLEGMYM